MDSELEFRIMDKLGVTFFEKIQNVFTNAC